MRALNNYLITDRHKILMVKKILFELINNSKAVAWFFYFLLL